MRIMVAIWPNAIGLDLKNFLFPFVYGVMGGKWQIFMTFHSNWLCASLYWLRMHEYLCNRSTTKYIYTHRAHEPRAWASWGVAPSPTRALLESFSHRSLCSFLKTLLGRFLSLSWQHFLTSNNPHHQQIVFLIWKWTPSGSLLLHCSFSALGEGEKS